ncbi:MAG: SCP2 sterol-binding domain-containing protein [Planktomarina sp.]
MSDILNQAVEALNDKMAGSGFSGTAKFAIEDEGAIVIDDTGARISDEDADVTLSASADVFQGIMDGSQNPTTAFMTGKLSVDGDMGKAMSLASVLS